MAANEQGPDIIGRALAWLMLMALVGAVLLYHGRPTHAYTPDQLGLTDIRASITACRDTLPGDLVDVQDQGSRRAAVSIRVKGHVRMCSTQFGRVVGVERP